MIESAKRELKATRALILCTLLLCLAGLLFVGIYIVYPAKCSTSAACSNIGQNGLWLRYYWYFGKKSDAEIKELAELLRNNQIRYAYFHVLDVKPDGNLRNRKPTEARHLTESLRALAPDTKLIAWISAGDVYPAHGTDLEKPGTAQTMAEQAKWLVTDCGFDGVQWDYERNRSNWPAFLALLDQTRQAMPQGKHLSVAAPLLYWRFPFTWSKDYFAEVAKHCDQIAVMGYDSGCLFPWSYVDLMSEQCTGIAPKIAGSNPNCKLIIGVPTYQRGDIPMHDFVETLKLALIGVRNGIGKLPPGSKQCFEGVAVFAEYTTDATEWQTYRQLWMCSN